ncbi:hypothetical protein N7499_010686 [Penicillium canescens]|uniref:Extracellular protein n=1 Tax=Penicillium canescens TaxID=5083 RepID=A0AAD6IIT0_PENCN|nr:uncharacterized protein N7446_005954 [Penicillium canescens]KAJ5990159.1 hypothetical protein N7522_010366 [Penicillium canescens]KAJ6051322.1 hypothetical protein N7460_001856 [Penicillium canescens]KAJ6061834.1 hypothetical protein N7446_005954 [Penicillium canescens]KAJ6065083.1 hypothetical protein N7444_000736 [Penicillium canescens]KAJ6068799.1 hypothetical protein N7499_010686 [Penicillium canescens]
MKGTFILSGLLASTVSAHMQLSKPYPIRSPLNKDAKGEKDYSYTNPLSSSGSDYPCKGYAKDEFNAVDTWAPGSSQEMELEGSATHNGGSCQLSLTYDQGKTFKVIQSVEGDCPIAKKYKFNIPSDAPTGDALFAWTWFNKVGNREMYMNCAMVNIGGSGGRAANNTNGSEEKAVPKNMPEMAADGSPADKIKSAVAKAKAKGQTKPKDHTKQSKAADTSYDSLPEIFVANVDQAGKCVTIEGEAVNFPKPGPNVLGQADGKGYKCSGTAPFLGDDGSNTTKNATSTTKNKTSTTKNATSTTEDATSATEDATSAAEDATSAAEDAASATEDATSTDKKMSKIASSFGTSTATGGARTLSTEASTNNQFSDYVGQWTCTSGEILCSPDGMSFALCNYGRPVFMGSVAAGTWCRWGAITAKH